MRAFFAGVVVFACGVVPCVFADGAQFVVLPQLVEGSSARPYGISSDGNVVVGWSIRDNRRRAVRWVNGEVHEIQSVPGSGSGSFAWDVSGDGSVVVGHGWSFSANRAYRWEANEFTNIPTLGGGTTVANAVSDDGDVVVGYSSIVGGGLGAFRWQDGVTENIGYLAGASDSPRSVASDIAGDSSVIVGYSESARSGDNVEAFRWEDGRMVGLGDLPGGIFESAATGVSDDGTTVVGWSRTTSSQEEREAFRWKDGEMIGLGDFPGGKYDSTAIAVSADGSVVVGWGESATLDAEAFFWDESNGLRNIKEMLETDFGVNLTGWQLGTAHDITPDGLTITGYGISPENQGVAWVITLPEPGSGLLLVGATSLALRRWR